MIFYRFLKKSVFNVYSLTPSNYFLIIIVKRTNLATYVYTYYVKHEISSGGWRTELIVIIVSFL